MRMPSAPTFPRPPALMTTAVAATPAGSATGKTSLIVAVSSPPQAHAHLMLSSVVFADCYIAFGRETVVSWVIVVVDGVQPEQCGLQLNVNVYSSISMNHRSVFVYVHHIKEDLE